MAVFLLQQEDTAADSGFVTTCSGVAAGSVTSDHQMIRSGTAGSTEVLPDPDNTSSSVLVFQSDITLPEPNVTTWDAGDYVIRLNVTTGRAATLWAASYICERTSGGAYNAVASLTGQTTAMGAGTQTMTVNRATDYSAAASSTVYIVLVFTGAAHGGTDVGITPSLIIDTPIDDGIAVTGRIMSSLVGSGGLAGPGGIAGPGGGLAGSPEMRLAV